MKRPDPPPLGAGLDTPEELRAVLRALGREGPGRASLERAARELGPYMDAAPGLPMPVVAAARSGGKLLVMRAFAGLLAISGTAYLVQRNGRPEVEPVAHAAHFEAREPDRPAAPALPATVPEVVAPVVAAPGRVGGVAERAPHVHVHRHHHATPARGETAHEETVPASEAARLDHAERRVASEDRDSAPAESSTSVAVPAQKLEAAAPTRAKVAEPPPDEVALLWRARERMRRDPAAALALLDVHADRFADGQLTPEREVLAVEALRLLGRKDEADAHVRTFRERYPGSIHLRRLQSGKP